MSDWSEGYMADIAYTFGYYAELNPQRVRLAFLNAGIAFPEAGSACELGFGQGLSTNLHAAASVTRWYGTDFNPAQAGFAAALADSCGSQARLFDESFDEFCRRTDLPDFDFIGLHGIFSWISDENRATIVDFLRRKLKVGGVVYISYNTQPGWAAMAPMRDLMAEYAELMCAPGSDVVTRIDASVEFAQRVLKTGSAYGRANPLVEQRLDAIKTQNRNYIAHEYFNSNWLPLSFSHMNGWLSKAKLSYAVSANMLEQVDAINLSEEQQKLLAGVPDRVFRETVRDFLLNTQFRRDYWVRGARQLPPIERLEQMRAQRVVLALPPVEVVLTVKGALGEGQLLPAVYEPLLELLADHQPRTLGEIESALAAKNVNLSQIFQAVIILTGKGVLYPAQDAATVDAVAGRSLQMNRRLWSGARDQSGIEALASPVTGGGLVVARFEQVFLSAIEQGLQQPEEWARYLHDLLTVQGQKMLKEGRPVEQQDQLRELVEQAVAFREKRLPLLRALRICA